MKKNLFYAFLGTFAMFWVYFLLNNLLTGAVWEGMTMSKSAVVGEYCELNDTKKFFHQSVNTYSNLVYFFFGLFICLIAKDDFKNANPQHRMEQFPMLSLMMGVSLIYLSVGSAFFHASLTWVGQRMDMNGTYSINIILVAIALYHVLYRISPSDRTKKWLPILLLVVIVAFYQVHLLISSSILLPIFILSIWLLTLINYLQFRKDRHLSIALCSIVLIIIALKIRQLDVDKIDCDPHSVWQGHSLWHLLAGLSSFCSYAFFRFKP